MLIRLLILAVLIWLVYRLVKAYAKSLEPPQIKAKSGGDMVRCAHCGIHIPKSEGLLQDGKVFCSEAHRNLDH